MDKWLTISKSAFDLGIHEDDLFFIALEGGITLSWRMIDFVALYDVDTNESEHKWMDYSNWEGPTSVIRSGYFDINLALCPDWGKSLNDIRCGGLGYGGIFESANPLVVHEVGSDNYKWSVTPPPELGIGKKLDFPTKNTLGVFRKELDRYINHLKQVETRPKASKMKQAKTAFKQALNTIDLSKVASEKGKNSLRHDIWIIVQYTKDLNGGYLFAKKGEGSPEKKIFNQYWKESNRVNLTI